MDETISLLHVPECALKATYSSKAQTSHPLYITHRVHGKISVDHSKNTRSTWIYHVTIEGTGTADSTHSEKSSPRTTQVTFLKHSCEIHILGGWDRTGKPKENWMENGESVWWEGLQHLALSKEQSCNKWSLLTWLRVWSRWIQLRLSHHLPPVRFWLPTIKRQAGAQKLQHTALVCGLFQY